MPETLAEQLLSRATEDVLEKMFFAGCTEAPTGSFHDDPTIAVRMAFDGERRGELALRISSIAARTLAADFLGADTEDGPGEAQVEEVVRELANMICGDALSGLEREPLHLAVPQIIPSSDFAVPATGSFRSFDLGEGALTVVLTFLEDDRG
jgi:hypothetical protein